MNESNDSASVRAGATTYFFDIKETKDGDPYLVITASRYMGEEKDRERSSIAVFPEHTQEFLESTQKIIEKLDQGESVAA